MVCWMSPPIPACQLHPGICLGDSTRVDDTYDNIASADCESQIGLSLLPYPYTPKIQKDIFITIPMVPPYRGRHRILSRESDPLRMKPPAWCCDRVAAHSP
jgi:hypothetical protein